MSYLSRRAREINAEDVRRKARIEYDITDTFIGDVKASHITAGIDWGFPKVMDTREYVNFRNRGA